MSIDNKGKGGNYDVGHGKPPKEHQFKKGKSGNPKGRPKAKKGGLADVAGVLSEPVRVKIDGKTRNMDAFEASVRQLAKKSITGNLLSAIKFIRLCEEYGVFVAPPPPTGGGVIIAPKGISPQDCVAMLRAERLENEALSDQSRE